MLWKKYIKMKVIQSEQPMREGSKYTEFASVLLIEVLQNIQCAKEVHVGSQGKKKGSPEKNPGLYLFTFSGQRKTLQTYMFVLDDWLLSENASVKEELICTIHFCGNSTNG